MSVRVIGPRDPRPEGTIDTTSRSRTWSRGLSPFFLGPVPLYPGAPVPTATCVENAWQYSKVYPEHVGFDGNPSPAYFEWATKGWQDPRAARYPMGKGRKPEYSWWAGERLTYIQAREKVYLPLYVQAVLASSAWGTLLTLYRASEELVLWDFDGYDHKKLGMTFAEVVRCESRKMGHALVLAVLLEKSGSSGDGPE